MLYLLTWTATGLVTGWLVRTLLRSRRDFGLAGDLTTGWLGGIVGGWISAASGPAPPTDPSDTYLVASLGAAILMAVLRVMRHLAFAARVVTGAPEPQAATAKDDGLGPLGHLERRIVEAVLTRRWPLRDPNQAFEADTTFGQRIADKVTKLDLLREQEWMRLVGLVEEQRQALGEIQARLETIAGGPQRMP